MDDIMMPDTQFMEWMGTEFDMATAESTEVILGLPDMHWVDPQRDFTYDPLSPSWQDGGEQAAGSTSSCTASVSPYPQQGAIPAVDDQDAETPVLQPGSDASSVDIPRTLLHYAPVPSSDKGLFICALCGYAPSNSTTWPQLLHHWRPKSHVEHQPIGKEEKNLAMAVYNAHCHHAVLSFKHWQPPRDMIAPMEHVRIKDGFECRVPDCSQRYIAASEGSSKRTVSAWREHMRRVHDQREFGRIGRPGVATALLVREENVGPGSVEPAWGKQFKIQQPYRQGPGVRVRSLDGEPTAHSGHKDAGEALNATFEALRRQASELDSERQGCIAPPSRYQTNSWAAHVGLARRLQGLPRVAARQVLDRACPEDEPMAALLWDLTGSMLMKCHGIMKNTGAYLRKALARVDWETTPWKPAEAYETPSSVVTHARTVQYCMSMFARTQLNSHCRALVPSYEVNGSIMDAWTELRAWLERPESAVVEEEEEGEFSVAENLTLTLFVRLLQQQGRINEADELVLITALQVLGIVPNEPRFKTANEYSSLLAGFCKMARYAINAFGAGDQARVCMLADECLTTTNNVAMGWVMDKKRYAHAAAASNVAEGRMTWIPETSSYLYKGHTLNMQQLRLIVHGCLQKQRTILCEELLFVTDLQAVPAIPWAKLVDRVRNDARGSCWTDPLNQQALAAGEQWLQRHVRATCPARFHNHRATQLSQRAVLEYGASMEKFSRGAVVQAILGSTMSMRATTAASIRWRNCNNGDEKRNLVVQGGRLTLVGGHTKTSWAGQEAPMHLLPDEVAELWGRYIWLVLPFWELLRVTGFSGDGMDADEGFLFRIPKAKRKHPTEWASAAVKEVTQSVLARGMTLNPARQFLTQFARCYIPADILAGGLSTLDSPRRSTRRDYPAEPKYGQGDEEAEESEDFVDNNLLPFDCHTLPDAAAGQARFAQVRDFIESRGQIARQTGHSLQTDLAHYGGEDTVHPMLNDVTHRVWMVVGEYWHLLLRFPSALAREQDRQPRRKKRVHATPPRRRSADADDRRARKQQRLDRPRPSQSHDDSEDASVTQTEASVRQTDATRWLRTLLQDSNATFRGNQWPVLDAMLNGPGESLLVVEPTGAGKSVLVLCPALRPNAGLTLVVAPFVALRNDYARRCREADINYLQWDGAMNAVPGMFLDTKVVLVSIEHLRQDSFHGLLGILSAGGLLKRIVLDEAHVVLTAKSWRSTVRDAHLLGSIGVTLVLLTATLPPVREPALLRILRIERGSVRTIRSPTVRVNTAYSVVRLASVLERDGEEVESSLDDVGVYVQQQHRVALEGRRRKIMAFIDSTATVKKLARCHPNAMVYYNGVPNPTQVLDDFRDTPGAVLYTTSAGEHAYDVPDIDEVLYASWPSSLEAFLQGAGRAGRNGRPARVILFTGVKCQRPKASTATDETRDQLVLEQFAQEDVPLSRATCRRVVIDGYMDGDTTRSGCDLETEVPCDVCSWHRDQTQAEHAVPLDTTTPGAHHDRRSTDADEPAEVTADVQPARRTVDRDDTRSHLPPPYATSQSVVSSAARPIARTPTTFRSLDPSSRSTSQYNHSGSRDRSPSFHSPWSNAGPPSPLANRHLRPSSPDRERKAGAAAWRAKWGNGQSEPAVFDRIHAMLLYWRYTCVAHALTGTMGKAHTKDECDAQDDIERIGREASQWTTSGYWKMAKYSGCFICKAPEGLCAGFGKCEKEWEHAIVDAWAMCLLHPGASKWLQEGMADVRGPKTPEGLRRLGQVREYHDGQKRRKTCDLVVRLVDVTELYFSKSNEDGRYQSLVEKTTLR